MRNDLVDKALKMSEHHIIVTSNVDDTRNTSGHFYNALSAPVVLDGNWKVGIKKIIYQNNFLNIIDEAMGFTTVRTTHDQYIGVQLLGDTMRPTATPNVMLKLYPFKNDAEEDEDDGKDGKDEDKPQKPEKGVLHLVVNIARYWPTLDYCHYKLMMKESNAEDFVLINEHLMSDKSRYEYSKTIELKNSRLADAEFKITIISPVHIIEKIPQGSYFTMDSMLKALPEIEGVEYQLTETGHVKIYMNNTLCTKVTLLNDLQLTLGFHETILLKTTIGSFRPRLNRGRFAFFIHSNICTSMHMGEGQTNLLDVISIPQTDSLETISLDVINPMYRTVALDTFQDIEIKVTSDSGEIIKFNNESGNAKTLLLLHFIKV